MQCNESGVLEIVITIHVVLLVTALAAVLGAISPGWSVPIRNTADIVTQVTPAIKFFLVPLLVTTVVMEPGEAGYIRGKRSEDPNRREKLKEEEAGKPGNKDRSGFGIRYPR